MVKVDRGPLLLSARRKPLIQKGQCPHHITHICAQMHQNRVCDNARRVLTTTRILRSKVTICMLSRICSLERDEDAADGCTESRPKQTRSNHIFIRAGWSCVSCKHGLIRACSDRESAFGSYWSCGGTRYHHLCQTPGIGSLQPSCTQDREVASGPLSRRTATSKACRSVPGLATPRLNARGSLSHR